MEFGQHQVCGDQLAFCCEQLSKRMVRIPVILIAPAE
jgi:hypothetical protein